MLGFRECGVADYAIAVDWLVEHVTQVERQVEQVRSELLGWLRREHLEPPAGARLMRVVRSALDRGESSWSSGSAPIWTLTCDFG